MNETKPKNAERLNAAPWGWSWPWSDETHAILEGLRQPTWIIPSGMTITYLPAPWECPRCHTINAPHIDRCDCKDS